jgi:hypothetical protein
MTDSEGERPQWFQDYLDSAEGPGGPHQKPVRFADLNSELRDVLGAMGKHEARMFLEVLRFWRDFKAVRGFLKWGILIIVSAFVAGAWLVHQVLDSLQWFKGSPN